MELFEKRADLILDYISQILVYGSNVSGKLSLQKYKFDDGTYIILTVQVLQNNYFRWHDLGIKNVDSKRFYDYLFNRIVDKFQKFSLSILDSALVIKSSVNHNEIIINFSLDKKSEREWFLGISSQI